MNDISKVNNAVAVMCFGSGILFGSMLEIIDPVHIEFLATGFVLMAILTVVRIAHAVKKNEGCK